MAEQRYTRLFSLPERLYAEGAPVFIQAGALLKDTQTGKVLAQLKFTSVSAKSIKALTVSIAPLDTAGQPLGQPVEHQYLDLNTRRGQAFGQKEAFVLPDLTSRGMVASVTKAVFADNSIWETGGGAWEPLPPSIRLEDGLGSQELAKQYRLTFGAACHDWYQEAKDLWFCPCGALNRKGEACHSCRRNASAFAKADLAALTADMEKRLAEEAEAEAQRKAEQDKRNAEIAKKTKKIAIIAGIVAAIIVAAALIVTKVILPAVNYSNAEKLLAARDYDNAIAAFTKLGNYKDAAERIPEAYYQKGEYLLSKEDYIGAVAAFQSAGDYKDVAKRLVNLTPLVVKIGETRCYGYYEQDNNITNGKEAIEWTVLTQEGNRILVISKYALDCQPYNQTFEDVTWETCTLRAWLNDTFLNTAFSSEEQAKIAVTQVSPDKNPDYTTNPGDETNDKIFLLSISEVEQYFASDTARACKGTAYCYALGAYKASLTSNCCWWLRSPGNRQDSATNVRGSGSLDFDGGRVGYNGGAVRPAMWISLV